ncbi:MULTISPECIES: 4-(cytidine 5'-diphospho)-2-C-methyl-D-erythritol kinase [Acetobacter]|uniref:4-(cytidine 5'-diphospho)-2-C-methyl-D-erythritol kinase n=1 Tax=Acetobacter TaxID=434 RepID=UPI000A3961A0|nr:MULTISPECIES: 4-(cytidine 5'-diphospho)-2-C-methyl-D-erythritol kinase [Acetobacter]MBS0980085.1 4-(cytidine 5'-diphospho)-2-C-methyl-D-erythritol kinase [Acetobacter thailandicus]MBS1003027.1 4-(cytidine 5'-diphospho)-2-C-methyl-D-erythritol kinase [Acetobacter thailandicus]OUI89321.1 4-diphosphocytidyl-2C-methyl-D-erythritol kinase [Acetobacter sp. DmW_043]
MSEKTENVSSQIFSESARAKINLYLHVTGKRADGYHLLDSLAVFAEACDELFYEPGDEELRLELTGRFGAPLGQDAAGQNNLVMKAAAMVQAAAGGAAKVPGGRLVLRKELPVASGIGGGSADAAAALRLLSRAWQVEPDSEALSLMAEKLGADVPVCLDSRAARMEGIGEKLSDAPALPPSCGILLVNCGVAVSTPEIFRRRDGHFVPRADLPDAWPDAQSLAGFLSLQSNSLQDAACLVCPPVRDVLNVLADIPDNLLVRMSGSGATCFAIFPDDATARQAAYSLSRNRPEWWVWGGGFC